MAAPSPLRTISLAALAAALSGALLLLGTGLHPAWWLTWLAPFPIAWAAPRLPGWTAAAAAAAAWAVGALGSWGYLRALHLPPGVVLLATLAPALVFALAVALLRALALRGAALRAALAVPASWVAYELLQARTGSHGTFGSLAYTQVEALPVLQLAAAGGVWAITFAVLFFPCAAAVALTPAVPLRRRLRLLGAMAAAALAVLGHGWARLGPAAPGEAIRVGLAASDARGDVLPQPAADGRLLRAYLSQAGALAAEGARVIVLPEKLLSVPDPDLPAVDAAVQAVADRTGAAVVLGLVREDGGAVRNEARVYRRGAAPASYRKRRLLPGWESRFTPGDAPLAVRDGRAAFGLAVCKDMDFPDTGRAYRDAGVDLLLVPAWDFERDGWLHARMAVVRGVEGGFGVVRSAKQGLLTVADGRGRILAERGSAGPGFARLVADVPLRHERTLYGRIGELPAWADLALAALLVLSLLRGRPGPRPARARRASGAAPGEEAARAAQGRVSPCNTTGPAV